MLKNTFIHIPGIGPKTERRFWDSGMEEPCSKLQGIFDCKEFCQFFDSLAYPAASCGVCARCAVHNWDDFTQNCPIRLSQSKMDTVASYLEESKQNLKFSNPNYFSDLLPSNQHWRFFPEFRDSTVYMDMETVDRIKRENIFGFQNSLYY
jgi:hypothetical protein